MSDAPTPGELPQAQARKHISDGLNRRVRESIKRTTPFMSEAAARELIDDVRDNVLSFLKEVFTL